MNLLIVSSQLPSLAWGAGIRAYHLMKALASKHTITLLAVHITDEEEKACRMSIVKDLTQNVELIARPASYLRKARGLVGLICGKSYILNSSILAEMQEALDKKLATGKFDAVIFEGMAISGYRVPKGVKIIIDQHNIAYEILQRTYQHTSTSWIRKRYSQWESRLVEPLEIARYRRADALLVTSERERLILQPQLPQKLIEVIPNGVDVEFFGAASMQGEVPNRIVFTGTMDYYPNVDAVHYFARKCWHHIRAELPEATWQIVGRNPTQSVQSLGELPGVTVMGEVPDVRPYIAEAAVALAPILIGSGTRLKILEAFAMSKAVVSTSLGCEGLAVESGRHLLVADQSVALAQAVIELLKDAERRKELGNAGRALVEAEYSWDYIGACLLHVLEEMCI